jgi:allantoin racemase
MVDAPVLGIAQAAMHAAALVAGLRGHFHVGQVPRAWELAKTYTPVHCAGVHACDIPVLRIDSDPATIDPIRALCRHALAHDNSRSIVLGCAAMARFAEPLSVELGVPEIDGVVAATVLAQALVGVPGLTG